MKLLPNWIKSLRVNSLKEYAHNSVSIGLGLSFITIFHLFIRLDFIFVIFLIFYFAIISKLNDWMDFRLSKEHKRKFITHSPFSPLLILISFASGLVFAMINIYFGLYLILVTYSIFIGHFLLDSLNPSGVPVTPKTRFSFNKIRYDDLKWNILFFLGGCLISSISILGVLIM